MLALAGEVDELFEQAGRHAHHLARFLSTRGCVQPLHRVRCPPSTASCRLYRRARWNRSNRCGRRNWRAAVQQVAVPVPALAFSVPDVPELPACGCGASSPAAHAQCVHHRHHFVVAQLQPIEEPCRQRRFALNADQERFERVRVIAERTTVPQDARHLSVCAARAADFRGERGCPAFRATRECSGRSPRATLPLLRRRSREFRGPRRAATRHRARQPRRFRQARARRRSSSSGTSGSGTSTGAVGPRFHSRLLFYRRVRDRLLFDRFCCAGFCSTTGGATDRFGGRFRLRSHERREIDDFCRTRRAFLRFDRSSSSSRRFGNVRVCQCRDLRRRVGQSLFRRDRIEHAEQASRARVQRAVSGVVERVVFETLVCAISASHKFVIGAWPWLSASLRSSCSAATISDNAPRSMAPPASPTGIRSRRAIPARHRGSAAQMQTHPRRPDPR